MVSMPRSSTAVRGMNTHVSSIRRRCARARYIYIEREREGEREREREIADRSLHCTLSML